MKIGTLTLHLPFNYGNALQMLSLHRYLIEQGHDAEVLSHWYFKDKGEVNHYHSRMKSWRGVLHFILDCLLFNGTLVQYMRECKIQKWLKEKIRWSLEEGYDGHFPCDRISHDIVMAGSDQIWNPVHRTSEFFLLNDFPDRVKKIAYAASMGTDKFIESKKGLFSSALKQFAHISMRESSGVEIVRNTLGCQAELVCDPTLLHTKEEWAKILGFQMPLKANKDLVMYLVTPDFVTHWREVAKLARQSGRRLHFYAFRQPEWAMSGFDVHHPVRSLSTAAHNITKRIILFLSGVRLHLSATPTEFVERIAKSHGLITDSFHGMMFATIFGKSCNVTIGEHAERQQMSARLRNFTDDFGRSEILTPNADLSAMREVTITPKLQKFIDTSKQWLKKALED